MFSPSLSKTDSLNIDPCILGTGNAAKAVPNETEKMLFIQSCPCTVEAVLSVDRVY